MQTRAFKQVDVFGNTAYFGNPLAVVLDGAGLSEQTMQRFARWTNLSETTFLLPPQNARADYRVRIFTPIRELPFAGHPTLGSCHAWLEAGHTPKEAGRVVQECAHGLVVVKQDSETLAFAAPALVKSGAVDENTLRQIVHGLGLNPTDVVAAEWVDNGPGWVGVLLRDATTVLGITPNYAALSGLEVGVVGPHPDNNECQFEVRAFVAQGETAGYEDPVTGSLNASLAQWLIGAGIAPARYVAAQGAALGCAGRVFLSQDETGQVWVGGRTATCVDGNVRL